MNMKKNKVMSRKYVGISLLTMIFVGALFGIAIRECFKVAGIDTFQNLSICIILFALLCIFFWLPLIVPAQQIAEVDEYTLYIIPKYGSLKKTKIAWYALVNNTIKPFYRSIPLTDIDKLTFTFESQIGAYAYKRFSFQLRFHVKEETIIIFINPGQNGPFMPSGYGLPFAGTLSKGEITNLIAYFRSAGIAINDPYKLEDAMKDEKLVLYDYLESFHKKVKY